MRCAWGVSHAYILVFLLKLVVALHMNNQGNSGGIEMKKY